MSDDKPYNDDEDQPEGLIRELKKYNQALQESEKKLQTKNIEVLNSLIEKETKYLSLFENTSDLIVSIAINEQVIFANYSWCKNTGYNKEELPEVSLKDFLHPDYKQLWDSKIKVLHSGVKSVRFEAYFKTKNKSMLYVDGNLHLYKHEGQPTEIRGIFRDITKHHNTIEAIRNSESTLKEIINNSPDAIFILDRDGSVVDFNNKVSSVFEIPLNEVTDYKFCDFFDCKKDENVFKVLQQSKDKTEKQQGETYVISPVNKKRFLAEYTLTKIHLKDKWYGLLHIRNIMWRKESELKEKRYTEELLLLNKSALSFLKLPSVDAICEFAGNTLSGYLDDTIVLINLHENENNFKLHTIAGIAKKQFERLDGLLGWNPIGKIFAYNNAIFQMVKDGKMFTYKNGLTGFFGDSGDEEIIAIFKTLFNINKIYTIGLVNDSDIYGCVHLVTRNKAEISQWSFVETLLKQATIALNRKFIEIELIDAKRKAEEADEVKSLFLANMSHEIRTPLNGILGFADLLKSRDIERKKMLKYLDLIYSSGKHLLSLMNDIIDISKIEARQLDVYVSEFSLNTLMDELFDFYKQELSIMNKVHIKLSIYKDLDDKESFIQTDKTRLRQILKKLIGNALKFTDEGEINFGYIIKDKNLFEFYVQDTGIGLTQEKLEQVFKQFVQADNSVTRRYSGAGLGLSISKGLVEMLGGKISASSKLGIGSKFVFTITSNYDNLQKTELMDVSEDEILEISKYNWMDKSVLIVEDDKISRFYLKAMLDETGVNIYFAEDGDEALKFFDNKTDIDLVLMDIQLPEVSGLEVTKYIKKINAMIPVIAQSANASPEDRKKCFEAGCNDFIAKPVQRDAILEAMRRQFDKQKEEI